MDKNNTTLVYKYINGDDIEGYSLEELENDKMFMKKVLEISKDYKLFYNSSDTLKQDFEFIKCIITIFKDNTDFIEKVADEFIEKNKGTLNYTNIIELMIIMSNLTKKDSDKNKVYEAVIQSYYNIDMILRDKTRNKINSKIFGKGFSFIQKLHESSGIVINYYAKRMMMEILEEDEMGLESLIHRSYKSKDKIDINQINKFILEVLNKYDKYISEYIMTHIDLLSDIKLSIKNIKDNWEEYETKLETEKYRRAIDTAKEYLEKTDSKMKKIKIIYYVAQELGINDKVAKYDIEMNEANYRKLMKSINEPVSENIKEDYNTYLINREFEEKKHYLNIKRIFKGIIFEDGTYKLIQTESSPNSKKSPPKILLFKPPTFNKPQS